MPHIFQVGAGSGGMAVLDLLARDPSVTSLTLVEPDVYKPHNVERHLFPASAVGEKKVALAARWLAERRPDVSVTCIDANLLDPAWQERVGEAIAGADIGICAADNEPAKYHFDSLMRRFGKPWTLGEVLSGGIGGFVHWFVPGGPCYGCVASHLQRTVEVEKPSTPDYSNPGAAAAETTVPASRASIATIAGLHALVTRGLLADGAAYNPGFTSMLFTLQLVPDVFTEAFRPHRFRIPRAEACLICRPPPREVAPEELDVALTQALARLGHERT